MPEMRPLIVGHRGCFGTAPANTMGALQQAVRMGADMVEVDVRVCRSGEPVLSHDPIVTDVFGRSYRLKDRPLNELKFVDLGSGWGVPSLREAVAWVRGKCGLMADLKEDGFEVRLAQELGTMPLDKLLVAGASPDSRIRLRQANPRIRLSLTMDAAPPGGFTGEYLQTIDTEAVTFAHELLDADLVARLQSLGKQVFAWTVDDHRRMLEVARMGVDGIISNRVDLAARL